MSSVIKSFGEVNFSHADLGDARRTRRLVATANLMRRRPGGSLPQKLNNPKDLRAFYRLMDRDEVTHQALLSSHRGATFDKIADRKSPVLILHDATELDYTTHLSLKDDLGQVGNGAHRGYIVQNSLAIDPKTRHVLGLCNQILHHRVTVPDNESVAEKRNRESRESLLWLKGTEPLPQSWQLVDVCDQGADTFEFLEHEANSGRRFVIRAAYDRCILIGHEVPARSEASNLRTFASTLPEAGTWTLSVTSKVEQKSPKRKGKKKIVCRKAREAKMAVSLRAGSNQTARQKERQSRQTPIDGVGGSGLGEEPAKGPRATRVVLDHQ